MSIPESSLWKKLQASGNIEFNGMNIDPVKEGIVGPERPGRRLIYSANTAPCEILIKLGKDSDIVIHEATVSE